MSEVITFPAIIINIYIVYFTPVIDQEIEQINSSFYKLMRLKRCATGLYYLAIKLLVF